MSASHSTVAYKPIPEFPGYRVGDDGSVWTCWGKTSRYGGGSAAILTDNWRQLAPVTKPTGYLNINLYRGGKMYSRRVSRLVLFAFVGSCPPGQECCHGDGNRTNNRLCNLRWGTKVENHADRVTHQTDPKGERNGRARLTPSQVVSIREEYATGDTSFPKLAKKYGIGITAVSNIVHRRRWAHVA